MAYRNDWTSTQEGSEAASSGHDLPGYCIGLYSGRRPHQAPQREGVRIRLICPTPSPLLLDRLRRCQLPSSSPERYINARTAKGPSFQVIKMQQEPAFELKEPTSSTEHTSGKGIFPIVRSGEDTSDEHSDQQDAVFRTTMTTTQDAHDMQRMGKTQELIRRFRQVSMISFVAIATAAWEIGLFIISPGLINGGRSGLIYSSIWNFIGFGPIYLSMSEMASMVCARCVSP